MITFADIKKWFLKLQKKKEYEKNKDLQRR